MQINHIPNPFSSFGCDVFSDAVMQARLDPNVYAALQHTIQDGSELTIETADAVAKAMMEWALEKGATHYTHWFQPMTGSTAEKRDSFLEIVGLNEQPILHFSGKSLIKGEADGSSFPSGGLRATFEARGYTTWDCTSPAFVKENSNGDLCLCIPTAFCAFSGESLDEKTPLLRSMEALNVQAVRVLHLLGETNVHHVTPTVGGEQEYFLINKQQFLRRKDLVYTGRTLFGAPPAKGQELADQYYAATPDRVSRFMKELNETLWKLGVPAKTQHNEVAPSQYELAPLFASANVATDHNQLIMEMMRRIADRHGLTCLLHEKPFQHVNGSGKHNNWSLTTDDGRNLLKPGKTDADNRLFLTFFVATLAAADEYASALLMSCATLGNQHRLGGHEAPPQIISAFIGNKLSQELRQLVNGVSSEAIQNSDELMHIGVSTLPVLHRDDTDRNRTSPFAFTGNKFEFRMVGSSQSLGLPNTVLNTIVAEMLMRIADTLEKEADPQAAWANVMSDLILKHHRIIFNGNNYAAEWREEAKRRNLPVIDNTVDAILVMDDPHVQDVFARHNVLHQNEFDARRDVALTGYSKMAQIEATTMLKISRQKLLPACLKYSTAVSQSLNEARAAGLNTGAQQKIAEDLCDKINVLYDAITTLQTAVEKTQALALDHKAHALSMRDNVLPHMNNLRSAVDALERIVDKQYWPMPSYGEMLFYVV